MRRKITSEIEVKVGRIGAPVTLVTLNGNRTVADALKAASITPKDTETVRINGENASMDDELENNDKVTLVKGVAGGC